MVDKAKGLREHVWYVCDGRCRDREYPIGCSYCDGGLSSCTVCNGAEGSLLPYCPGRAMTQEENQINYAVMMSWDGKTIEQRYEERRKARSAASGRVQL